ncbi:MAG: glycoside hydrolase family 125 protein [Dethiobacteria bacterium]
MDRKEEYQKLLTLPEEITENEILYLTGNEFISLPQIDPAGGLASLNLLRLDCRGLLEFCGSPEERLISPTLRINNTDLELSKTLKWQYALDWIPSFKTEDLHGCNLEGEIVTPPGCKGFFYRLNLENRSGNPVEVEVGWKGKWAAFNHIVLSRREIEGRRKLDFDNWTGSLILEGASGLPLAAIALAVDPQCPWSYERESGSFSCNDKITLDAGESYENILYVAVNLESDGAGTTNIDLRRQGITALKELTVNWLESRRIDEKDARISKLLNRNLFFCYFYAAGCCLESEKLVPVTSRSPRYYVSAAFWSRDTLLWSFPAMLMADQYRARELLMTVYSRHIDNAGDHAHYINGTLLYPGFELDQLAAYIIALAHYLKETEDYSLLEEKVIAEGLTRVVDKALERFDPEVGLYSTFLDPSDDPVFYPYLTYSNALLQCAFRFLGELQADDKWAHKGDFAILAGELTHSIYEHCMVKGPLGIMFAWSVNGRGKFALYDNPPGSLQLLAHYGFCSTSEIAYKNTVRWIRSSNNRFFHQGGNFEEAGSVHAGKPWPLAACNDLLSCNAGAIDFLSRAEMDNGFFCETINPESGRVSTGAAFASAAGFLAFALKNRILESDVCSPDEATEKSDPEVEKQ